MKKIIALLICFSFALFVGQIQAAKIIELKIIDKDYILVRFIDGTVVFDEDLARLGSNAYTEHNPGAWKNYVTWHGEKLNIAEAVNTANWTIISSDDTDFGTEGINPSECFRKTKIDGMAELNWVGNDFEYDYTMSNSIFLKLPKSLKQGKTYTIKIDEKTKSEETSKDLTVDIFNNISEAIHINLVGYLDDSSIKSADLYQWMGDGGARDYSAFVGKKVYLYDVNTKESTEVGSVSFWKRSGKEYAGHNFTQSDVWNIDFTGFSTPGTYRLAVEGVGCSQDFKISEKAFYEPFMVSTRGYFYTRVGQDNLDMVPVPRRPLFIPGVSPANTKVYITTMNPLHSAWHTFTSGDPWDNNSSSGWEKYKKSGSPQNNKVRGGHGDAFDNDRHLGHISSIYDMLLPFILTGGTISDDDLGIAESGNGIPDILDEARNEVDFWLSLRDGKGYGHGLTNANNQNVMFQGGESAVAAWANAANCAMISDCFQISGLDSLMNIYRDSAIVAYDYASALLNQELNSKQDVGDCTIRGKDLKMMAAAFLYNITGDTIYEDDVKKESVATNYTSTIMTWDYTQIWGTAGYLMTKRSVNYPTLYNRMKASIIREAKNEEANNTLNRPTRRAAASATWWRTPQRVHRTMIAHAVTTNATEKAFFEKALILEADWGLGRNPLNMIQMTTATTSLGNKRSVENMYTTGRNDGSPGVHPGHTPYMGTGKWNDGVMGDPTLMTAKCYPAGFDANWPQAEAYFNTRYVYANAEFTPQQTMRGKLAMYGYLHGMNKEHIKKYTLKVDSRAGTFQINPEKESYDYGETVTITYIPNEKYTFKKWSGDAQGTEIPLTIEMYSNKIIVAEVHTPVGINEIEISEINIYPNPATDKLYFNKKGEVGAINLSIYDMNGKTVLNRKIESLENSINIEALKQGIYYLRMVLKDNVVDFKLVILRN